MSCKKTLPLGDFFSPIDRQKIVIYLTLSMCYKNNKTPNSGFGLIINGLLSAVTVCVHGKGRHKQKPTKKKKIK